MNIYTASNQWASRPDDERFWDLAEMYEAVNGYKQGAATSTYKLGELAVVPQGKELVVKSPIGGGAIMTNYAFGQLAGRLAAPASYLRRLPTEKAADLVNYHLQTVGDANGEREAVIMHHGVNGHRVARCITSEKYTRVWNADIVRWLMDLPAGWRNVHGMAKGDGVRSRVAEEKDCLKTTQFGIRPGELISPAGLYASDRDMYAFLINDDRAIEWKGHTLFRGVIISNSEVGDGSLAMTMFLLDDVCRNHIIWGAEQVLEVRVRHIGDTVRTRYLQGQRKILRAVDEGFTQDLVLLAKAADYRLGKDKTAVVEKVSRYTALTDGQAQQAWETAVKHEAEHGDPTTAYAQMSAVTRMSQTQTTYASSRDTMDREARKILEMAF